MNDNKNSIVLLDDAAKQLGTMVQDTITFQTELNPIYKAISKKVVELFSVDGELDGMETKDLINLLKVMNEAQIKPVVELTKLVQSVNVLQEGSALREKITKLETLIANFTKPDDFKPDEDTDVVTAEFTDIKDV